MKVGIVGCGNIAADICIALHKGSIPAEVVALTDVDPERAKIVLRTFQLDAEICDLDENVSKVDFVIECAVTDAVKEVLEAAIRHQKDCLILSVGGLMFDDKLYKDALASGIHVRLPSGATCGLDGIRSAMEMGLHHVMLTTRKPIQGLEGAPYLVENNIRLGEIEEPLVIFEGSAREAVKAFPQNVNVAAAISFAGIGPDETQVRIIADPQATLNIHEVVAEGAFGRLTTVTENMPSPRNPKSSHLASLSATAELRAAANTFTAQVSTATGQAGTLTNTIK